MGDGAIEEIKSIPELVGFGLQLATEPEVAKGIWNSIKSLTPNQVKNMLVGAIDEKIAKYTGDSFTRRHEAGKDGVQVAMLFLSGGVKAGTKIKEGTDLMDDLARNVGSKLDEVAEEVTESLRKNIAPDAQEIYIKSIRNNDLGKEALEELGEETKGSVTKADKPYIENFVKGKHYEKRIDAKIDAKDADYFQEAATKFENIDYDDLISLAETRQLQINIGNGNHFVADNVFHKRVPDIDNTFEVWINETKLSVGTAPTDRQGEFLTELSKGVTTFTVRSLDKGIPKNANIIIKSVVKTGGNGTVSDVFSISKLF